MSADRNEIVSFCDELLAIGEFDDYPDPHATIGARTVGKSIHDP